MMVKFRAGRYISIIYADFERIKFGACPIMADFYKFFHEFRGLQQLIAVSYAYVEMKCKDIF